MPEAISQHTFDAMVNKIVVGTAIHNEPPIDYGKFRHNLKEAF
ncbi:hypothetical protein JCM19238_5603 [Vibrio ponticus]|nr:hypothetical protein JCM19238_5603 [Vibrio ponticus]